MLWSDNIHSRTKQKNTEINKTKSAAIHSILSIESRQHDRRRQMVLNNELNRSVVDCGCRRNFCVFSVRIQSFLHCTRLFQQGWVGIPLRENQTIARTTTNFRADGFFLYSHIAYMRYPTRWILNWYAVYRCSLKLVVFCPTIYISVYLCIHIYIYQ